MRKEMISVVAVLVNFLLTIFKIGIGIISRSSAILADGIHSGMDIVSSGISYFGIKASRKPVDKKHPYGHYKSEVIAGFVITIILFVTALWIIYDAGINLLGIKTLRVSYLALGIMFASAVINEIMARLKFRYGKKYESMSLIADANHSRVDVLTSLGVLVGLLLSSYWVHADSVAAVLIGVYIMWRSVSLGKETTDSLLNVSAGDEIEGKITKTVKEEGIELWGLKTQKLGPEIFAELRIGLDPKLNVEEASKISKKLETRLKEVIPQLRYIVIQIESHKVKESFYMGGFGKMQWRGRMGGFRMGPSGECVCTNPKCGYKVQHQRGIPCYQMKCPKCGNPMTRAR